MKLITVSLSALKFFVNSEMIIPTHEDFIARLQKSINGINDNLSVNPKIGALDINSQLEIMDGQYNDATGQFKYRDADE